MPMSTSAPDKSRQTSAGKSFFGRKLHKDKEKEKDRPVVEDRDGAQMYGYGYGAGAQGGYGYGYGHGYGGLENLAPPGSSAGSRSSKHSKRASIQSVDMTQDADPNGYMSAGVVTSIPFESLPADTKSPVPVDNASKSESNARRDPSPNTFAKSTGDFHQYPAWNPASVQQMQQYSSHPTGPRPPPHASNVTMTGSSSGDRGARYQQWGRPGSSSAANPGFSHNSSSTLDSSANSRMSIDQTSIHSSVSSNPRGSGYFSSDSSSRTLKTSHSGDRNTLFSNGSSRSSAWPSQPTSAPSVPDKYLSRPRDDRIVDQLFLDLMQKRGWQNLPEQAKRQMLSYPASKKWTLVHQDRLTELQGEQKRRQNARQTYGHDNPHRADEEGSPEWYVKKVMDDTITSKQLASLSVSLRTQPIRYVPFDGVLKILMKIAGSKLLSRHKARSL